MAQSDFLTPSWLSKATDIISKIPASKEYRPLKFDDGNDLVVKYINTTKTDQVIHFQRWKGAKLQSWQLEEESAPDLVIKRNMQLEYNCWAGEPNSKDVLENTYISTPQNQTQFTFPISSEMFYEICKDLYRVKHSDFIFQFHLTDIPWGGPLTYFIELVEGIPEKSWLKEGLDQSSESKAGVKCSFVDGLSLLLGQTIFREMGANCEYLGDFLGMNYFSGLVAKPRTAKAFAVFENTARFYLSLISRMATLDFDIVRKELSSI